MRAASPLDFHWLQERTAAVPGPEFRAIEVRNTSGQIAGMVGFDDWTKNSAQLYVAVDEAWAMVPLVRAGFRYVFVDAGRGVALTVTRESNVQSLFMQERLGFRRVVTLLDAWSEGEGLVVSEMRRADCRWLTPRLRLVGGVHGKVSTSSARLQSRG